ncbi:hypothetical protein EV1_027259 [Malus domestica]
MTELQVPVEAHDNQADDALTHDVAVLDNPKDDDQNPMGHSVIENIAKDGQANNDDKLKTALAILFPYSSSANIQHLKPLYDPH